MRRFYFTHFTMIPTNNGDGNDTTGQNTPAGTYTQAQLDQAIAQEAAKAKKERDGIVSQLETLKKSQTLTAKEKQELQTKIDELQSLNLSKEQIAQQEAEKLRKTHTDELNNLSGERDRWKGEYETYRMRSEILAAASSSNAYNADQLVELLLPKTKLIELKENVGGQEVTKYQSIVKFSDKDKDGKPVVLDLSIGDAIKRMRELPETFGNLFKSDAKGGTGLLNNGGSPANKVGIRPGMSQEEYMKIRGQLGFGAKIR